MAKNRSEPRGLRMLDSKWVSGVAVDDRLADAAPEIVSTRLREVGPRLEQALREWSGSSGADESTGPAEQVHQLRVATRRADAALRAFRGLFDPYRWTKMRRRLKRIRGAAADARMCDVHLEILRKRLASVGDEVGRSALGLVVEHARRSRRVAHRELKETADRCAPEKLDRAIGRLERTAKRAPAPSSHETFGETATSVITEGVQALESAAARDLSSFEDLHELRLEAKRLRYAIEIFAECFPPELREAAYADVRSVQDRLGYVNDLHELAERFLATASALRGDAADGGETPAAELERLDSFAESIERERDTERGAFLEWWGAGGRERVLGRLERIVGGDLAAAS